MTARIYRALKRLACSEDGTTALEYAFIAGLVSVAAIVGFNALGDSVTNIFGAIESDFSDQMPS